MSRAVGRGEVGRVLNRSPLFHGGHHHPFSFSFSTSSSSPPPPPKTNSASAASAADAKARMITQAPPPRGADDPEPATVDFGAEGPLALSGLCTAPGSAAASKKGSGPEPVSACFWRVEEVPPQQQKTKPRFHVEF